MKPIIKKLVTVSLASALTLMLLTALAMLGAYAYITPQLPDTDTLRDVQLQVPLRVYADNGGLIAEFGEMRRNPMNYEDFPPLLIQAVLAAEDDRFFQHPGVDYQGILRAALNLLRTGEKGQGGSTITMQVARNFFLSREKTYLRKLNEIFLALKIEGELSKEEILSLYLNKIYLGQRAYGVAAAAQIYYGRSIQDLGLDEYAVIAGLPKAPSTNNPAVNPLRAQQRRNYVLGRMRDLQYISEADYQAAVSRPVVAAIHGQPLEVDAMYVAEMVRNDMVERFGDEAYIGGFDVYTTINPVLQHAANTALQQNLLDYDRRHGYRGSLGRVDLLAPQTSLVDFDPQGRLNLLSNYAAPGPLTPAVVLEVEADAVHALTRDNRMVYIPWEQLAWARKYIDEDRLGPELKSAHELLKAGEIIYVTPAQPGCSWLAQIPDVAGALVSLDPQNGAIRALVGGFDFYQSKFNRVTQAKRQPGSSFKPFIYAAAIDKGFTAASIINDAPVVFDAPGLEDTWRPANYSGRFYGPTRLRLALVNSRNLVSIRLLREIGIGYSLRYLERFGFSRHSLPRDLSLALGSGVMTPLELAEGYAVFANGGFRVQPSVIDHILLANQNVMLLSDPARVCAECLPEIDEPEAPVSAADEELPAVEAEPEPVQVALPVDWTPSYTEQDVGPSEWAQVTQGPVLPRLAPRVLNSKTTFLMNTMMRDVIHQGTGRAALALQRRDLAGKTGTTNEQRDAWFAGFNPQLVTIAWVGFDTPLPLGNRETGARAALPMWVNYSRVALQNQPEVLLQQPTGITSVLIDPESGKLAASGSADAIFEYFLEDQVPTQRAEQQTASDFRSPESGHITEELF